MALSRLLSGAASGLDQREVRDILEGQLTTDHPKPSSKCIRIFLSSELSDAHHERKALREKVFPHLRSFSRSLGLQLHVVDLYNALPSDWLPPDAVTSDGGGGADGGGGGTGRGGAGEEGTGGEEGDSEERNGKESGEGQRSEVEGIDARGGGGVGGEGGGGAGGAGGGAAGGSEAMCRLELQGLFQLALNEIRNCQDRSCGPSFITLLGQKYGHRPLPASIPEEEYKRLCGAMEDTADERKLVQRWYKLNSNTCPPHYELLQQLPQDCNEDWVNTQRLLSSTLRRAAKVTLGKDGSKAQKYIMSVTEGEVTAGLFQLKANPNQCCLWSKRTFTDLLEQKSTGDPVLALYCDLVAGRKGLEFDSEALKALNHLKETRMPAKYIGLDASNVFEFPIKWEKGKGLDPIGCPSHGDYLTQMCDSLSQSLEQQVSVAADIVSQQSCHPTYQEALVHGRHCRSLSSSHMDRRCISRSVEAYLRSSATQPLVVHGVTGCGKTTVMATAAYHLREGNPGVKMTIIVRFLRLTPHSSTIFHTLRSITNQPRFQAFSLLHVEGEGLELRLLYTSNVPEWNVFFYEPSQMGVSSLQETKMFALSSEIAEVYDKKEAMVPGDYSGVVRLFTECLELASTNRPLYIFLDGVDQLSPEDGASGMSWLPLNLPPHVKLVLSTSSEPEYRTFPVLQSLLLAKYPTSMIQVPQLSEDECQQMLNHCLSLKQRSLNPDQMKMAMTTLKQCPNPLFLQLMMRRLKDLKSFTTSLELNIPTTINGLIESYFMELEEKYGVVLVGRLLAYITASKYGLTEPEILDLLALDKEVMTQVKSEVSSRTELVFIPPVIWSQLYLNLQPLVDYRVGVENSLVLCWTHRRFREVAATRYLPEHSAQKVYSLMGDYFNGTSSVKKEVDTGGQYGEKTESLEALYAVNTQPLLLNESLEQFNIRKLVELPHALARSGRFAYQALTELLLDYQWLKACVFSLSCWDLVHDFASVIPTVPIGRKSNDVDQELRLLRQALMYSTDALDKDCSQLSTQLAGRLLPYISHSSDKIYPILKKLVVTALEDMQSALVPLHPLPLVPGGPHLVSMAGHRDRVSSVSVTMAREGKSLVLVTGSWDRSIKTWDLGTGGVLKTFDGHTGRVLSVAVTADGEYVVSGSEDTSVRYWHIPSGKCVQVMKGHSGAVNSVAVTADGSRAVSTSSDATVKVWNTDQSSSFSGQLIYTHRDLRKPVSVTTLRGNVIAMGTSGGRLVLLDIVSGVQLRAITGHGRSITALATEEVEGDCYLVSGCAGGQVKVWNFHNFNLIHDLVTATNTRGSIQSISMGPNGRLLIASEKKEPEVWDVKSGTHLYDLPRQEARVYATAITDSGRLAITGSTTNPSLTIWDILSSPVQHTTRLHPGEDVMTVALSGCGCLGVSTTKSGRVCVFDADTMAVIQCLKPHSASVNQVLAHKEGNKLFSASSDGSVSLWNGETGETLMIFQTPEETKTPLNCLAITATKDLLMTGAEDGEVAFWSIETGKKLRSFADHTAGVLSVAFITQGRGQFILSASRDGVLCIRELFSSNMVVTTSTYTDDLLCSAVAPNSQLMVTGSSSGLDYIVSLPHGVLTATLAGHTAAVNCIKVFPDSSRCVSGSSDRTVRIWTLNNGLCAAVLHTDTPILACDISHSNIVLYGGEGGWVATAGFHSDTNKPNPFVNQLNTDEPISTTTTTTHSSSIATPKSPPHQPSNTRNGERSDQYYTKMLVNDDSLKMDKQSSTAPRNEEEVPTIEPIDSAAIPSPAESPGPLSNNRQGQGNEMPSDQRPISGGNLGSTTTGGGGDGDKSRSVTNVRDTT